MRPPGRPRFFGLVGVATRDVTPPIGIYSGLWGAAKWDRTTGVHQPLTASALYLAADDATHGVLIVVFDGGAWRRMEEELAIRSAIMGATGLGPDRVVLHLTHTHSGPSLCAEDEGQDGGELIAGNLENMMQGAVAVATEAQETAAPASIDWARGSSRLASVRDLPAEGRYLTGWYPDEVADDTVLVGRISDGDGRPLATLVNYACHPTTLAWENTKLSPDYIGSVRRTVEAATGVPCIFLQGSEGDLAPREQYSGDTALAERHGDGLGRAALAALELLPEPAAGIPQVNATQRDVLASIGAATLRLKAARDIPALAKRYWPDLDPETMATRVKRAEWRRRTAGDGDTVDFPIWVWRIGDAFIVAQSGETYSEFQRELRRRHPDAPIVVLSLANGPIWTYFPIAERFDFNLYQAWHTPLQKGGHEAIVELADRLIDSAAASQPA
jgi:hypothetical protein